MTILSIILICFSQATPSFFTQDVFEIKGTSTFYDDKELIFEPVLNSFIDSGYVACKIISKDTNALINIVRVKDRKFSVKGFLGYPVPFSVSFYNEKLNLGHTSAPFFAEMGVTRFEVKEISSHSDIETNHNKSNDEYQHIKKITGWSYYLDNNTEQVKKDKIQKELGKYILDNPTSHVAMWLLMMSYTQDGYSVEISENSNYFAKEIRRLAPFITFKEKLRVDEKIYNPLREDPQPFPFDDFSLGNELRNHTMRSKYTIVDFWATWCKPCILQFDSLTIIHEKYYKDGFNILSVSIDNKEKENKAIEILLSKSVKWLNIFDYDGVDFNKFTNVLPYNFLIDQSGNLIDKNISVERLDTFLYGKLRSP
jgi:thiol-disulfide isomerase/thioredoxin